LVARDRANGVDSNRGAGQRPSVKRSQTAPAEVTVGFDTAFEKPPHEDEFTTHAPKKTKGKQKRSKSRGEREPGAYEQDPHAYQQASDEHEATREPTLLRGRNESQKPSHVHASAESHGNEEQARESESKKRDQNNSGVKSTDRRDATVAEEESNPDKAWYAGMTKDFHERRAEKKDKDTKSDKWGRKKKANDADASKSNVYASTGASSDASPSSNVPRHTKGTATPPRNTDDSDSGFGCRTETTEGTGSLGGVCADALPIGTNSKEITAKLDVELDQTQGKDLEWRRRHFKALLLKWHPDKNREGSVVAGEVFKHLMKRRAVYLET